MYNWDHKNCPLYAVAGCPLFRGCLSIEVNGRTVGTFRIVRYIMGVRFSGVSVKQGSTVLQTKTADTAHMRIIASVTRPFSQFLGGAWG